jgi:hypothetical protein
VFAGLDAAVAAAPAIQPPTVQPPVVPAPAPAPAAEEPEVREPLFPPPGQPYQPPTTSVHDLGAFAAFDGPHEAYDGVLGGVADDADAGIPAYEEPTAVLPVPPPAEPEPTGRRRGRRSR